ncbi:MAG: response regulator [Clostridia bacterium]|nr:response regulator [Clostridia bacterium]
MINVLIVEDDPMVAELNKRYIQSVEGFSVMGIVSNGEDALNFCKKNKVELILLDIYIPKIDGIHFLKELRRRCMMIDVILVTASKESQNIDAALKLGATDYLIKPFEYERLKKSLESYLKQYKLLHSADTVKQEDLDKIRINFEMQGDNELIKGLHKNTLERIRTLMKDNGKEYLPVK